VKFDDGDRDRAVPKRSIKKAGDESSFGGRSDDGQVIAAARGVACGAKCLASGAAVAEEKRLGGSGSGSGSSSGGSGSGSSGASASDTAVASATNREVRLFVQFGKGVVLDIPTPSSSAFRALIDKWALEVECEGFEKGEFEHELRVRWCKAAEQAAEVDAVGNRHTAAGKLVKAAPLFGSARVGFFRVIASCQFAAGNLASNRNSNWVGSIKCTAQGLQASDGLPLPPAVLACTSATVMRKQPFKAFMAGTKNFECAMSDNRIRDFEQNSRVFLLEGKSMLKRPLVEEVERIHKLCCRMEQLGKFPRR
jgi:hypothetical protein